jgi:hypothetical protein
LVVVVDGVWCDGILRRKKVIGLEVSRVVGGVVRRVRDVCRGMQREVDDVGQ